MSELAEKDCVPCKGGVPPLKGAALADLQTKLGNGWEVISEHHLEKEFTFKNFSECLAKIFERKLLFQMMFTDDFPAIAQLRLQIGQRRSLQRRHAPFARDAVFFRQFAHDALIIGSNYPNFQPAVGCARNQSKVRSRIVADDVRRRILA